MDLSKHMLFQSVRLVGAVGIGSSRQNCESSGVRVPVRLIACSRPIAYPMRAKATTHVLLGRKRLSCPVGKLTAVGAIREASKLGGLNIRK